MARDRTAALIVIGNEILSGKVVDTNSSYLARELRALGVSLRRIVVIPDEIDTIAAAVRELRSECEVVFTSGGVGPTHDDVTIGGVAVGLGRAVIRHPSLESKLREFFGDGVNEARLKMAEVVEGTELLYEGNLSFPTLRVENIYILPGIPEIFREKFDALRQRFAADPFHLRAIYTSAPESTIASSLNEVLRTFPALLLGSYPKLNDPEYRVRVTLESKDREYLERAFEALLRLLPPGAVVRTE
jgi:molybdenum cofactor synthesis domain-containing protein